MLQLICTPCDAADEKFGRLFFTLEQRQHLDRLRAVGQQRAKPGVSQATLPRRSESDNAVMQGYVKRSDVNHSTIWVNGEALQEGSRHAGE